MKRDAAYRLVAARLQELRLDAEVERMTLAEFLRVRCLERVTVSGREPRFILNGRVLDAPLICRLAWALSVRRARQAPPHGIRIIHGRILFVIPGQNEGGDKLYTRGLHP